MTKKKTDNSGELYEFDKRYYNEYPLVCGVDEAGRGPLAGDVYAAAVIFAPDMVIEGINDSKKLSEKKRDELFEEIKSKALCWAVAAASVEEIEKLNILNAAMLAMQRAVQGLSVQPAYLLVDGNKSPSLAIPCETVIKGDATSASIAAASIMAKVARDRYMTEQAKYYPQYGFEKHKGYGTAEHRAAILQYGACPLHRPSFLTKIL